MLKKALILVLLSTSIASSASNDYGEVSAFFNKKEAPVTNASAKVGQPFEVDVSIILKKDANVSLVLSASGFRDESKQPFATLEGPSRFDENLALDNKKSGDEMKLNWRLNPTDLWVGGSVPLNIDVNFKDRTTKRGYPLVISIANIYIEPAGGAQPAPAAATPRQPGFEIAIAALSLLGVALAARRRRD